MAASNIPNRYCWHQFMTNLLDLDYLVGKLNFGLIAVNFIQQTLILSANTLKLKLIYNYLHMSTQVDSNSVTN